MFFAYAAEHGTRWFFERRLWISQSIVAGGVAGCKVSGAPIG